jgi:hypothetical protein
MTIISFSVILLISVAVAVLCATTSSDYLFLLLILIAIVTSVDLELLIKVHLLILMALGRCIIRAVLFPYGNKLVTKYLDNQMNERFGREFVRILERTYSQIREYMIEPVVIDSVAMEEDSGRVLALNSCN